MTVGGEIISSGYFSHADNETGSCTYVPSMTASPRISVNIETFQGGAYDLKTALQDWGPCGPLSEPVGLQSYGCPGDGDGVGGAARVFVLYKSDRYFLIGSQSMPPQTGQSSVDAYGRLAAKVLENVQ